MDCSLPGFSVHGLSQAKILEWVTISLSRGNLPDPEIKPVSPALQADSLTAEPPGKPFSEVNSIKDKETDIYKKLSILSKYI